MNLAIPTKIFAPSIDALAIMIDQKRCAQSFAEFVKRAWPIVEPVAKLKWDWFLDAMCEHLEAVTYGEIIRLLMNVPPGTMKSKMCAVFWPAWEWGPANMPHIRFIGTSHKQELAVRDSVLMRRLVKSKWYQDRWPHVQITSDQDEKKKFENTATGFREAAAFTSMTGSRGDRILLDDPHSVDDANSPAEIYNVRTTFKEALPTRVNDEKSAIVVIMQRLHSEDVSGIIINEGYKYTHLMLPMRFEPSRRCVTSIGFKDPRTRAGELLSTARFPEAQVVQLENDLGPYAVAGQLQQRPTPREGGLFKRAWFDGKIVHEIPQGTRFVRHWDLAATNSKTAARSAGVKIGETPSGQYIVADCRTFQEEGHQIRKRILESAEIDGLSTVISLPQDPGQAGKVQKQDFAVTLAGWNFTINIETGDKATRAEPFSSQCEAGNVYLLHGDWIPEYIDELCLFPGGKFKDRVDASSGAFGRLVTNPKPKTSTRTTKVATHG